MTPATTAQLHLAINHAPVMGLPFGAALIAWGLLRRSEELVRAGLAAVAIAGLSAAVVYWSGLRVGDVALDWPGIDAAAVDAHFRAAKVAAGAGVAVGVGALLAATGSRRRAALVILLAAFAATGLAGRAAHLGGLIKHTELR